MLLSNLLLSWLFPPGWSRKECAMPWRAATAAALRGAKRSSRRMFFGAADGKILDLRYLKKWSPKMVVHFFKTCWNQLFRVFQFFSFFFWLHPPKKQVPAAIFVGRGSKTKKNPPELLSPATWSEWGHGLPPLASWLQALRFWSSKRSLTFRVPWCITFAIS